MFIIMELNMKVIGLMTNNMGKGERCGLTNLFMKVNTKMDRSMAKGYSFGGMGIVIAVNLLIIKWKGKEFLCGKLKGKFMMENGVII